MKRLAFSLALVMILMQPAYAFEFNLGKIYQSNGVSAMQNKDYEAAINWFTLAHNVVGDADLKLDGKINEQLGTCYMKINDLANAEQAFKLAWGHYEHEYGAFNANTARILDNFAEISFRKKDFWSANSHLRKAFDYSLGDSPTKINDLNSIPYRVSRLTYWASKTGNDIELEFERGLSSLSARRAKLSPEIQNKVDATIDKILSSWKGWAQKNNVPMRRYEQASLEYAPNLASKPSSPPPSAPAHAVGIQPGFHIPSLGTTLTTPVPSISPLYPSKSTTTIYRPANPFEPTKQYLKSHETYYSPLEKELFSSED